MTTNPRHGSYPPRGTGQDSGGMECCSSISLCSFVGRHVHLISRCSAIRRVNRKKSRFGHVETRYSVCMAAGAGDAVLMHCRVCDESADRCVNAFGNPSPVSQKPPTATRAVCRLEFNHSASALFFFFFACMHVP